MPVAALLSLPLVAEHILTAQLAASGCEPLASSPARCHHLGTCWYAACTDVTAPPTPKAIYVACGVTMRRPRKDISIGCAALVIGGGRRGGGYHTAHWRIFRFCLRLGCRADWVVRLPERGSVTFLDTPGHAAFSAMRSRGLTSSSICFFMLALATAPDSALLFA